MTLTLVKIATVLLLIADDGRETEAKPQQIRPGCRYEGRRYQEGTVVGTSEPCLQCRCTEGALRCRLRVCPRLPNSPPPGCRVRPPGENVCCAELVCGESRDAENMLRRTNTAAVQKSENEADIRHSRTQGCLHEGVRYAPGSAMMGSRRCEYCYCISGARRCIRPKCLLPLPGCTPLYAPHSCCPVAYNCTHIHVSTAAPVSGNGNHGRSAQTAHAKDLRPPVGITFRTSASRHSTSAAEIHCSIRDDLLKPVIGTGCRVGDRPYHQDKIVRDINRVTCCRVGDRVYDEGEMVRDISWKAACDNCFCAMAAIRCVPLACAPPLQGCSPIVRQGQCCPSTYNCSGSIEVKAAQNYASYAFISKDYAKFRKETNFFPAIEQTTNPSVEGRGHRVVDERIDTSTIDLEGESSVPTDSTSWASTLETEIMDNEILETMDYTKSTLDISSTTTLPSTDESTTNTESAAPDSTTTIKDANTITETVSDSSTTSQYSTNLVSESLAAVTDKSQASEDITTSIIDSTVSNVELTTAKWSDEIVDIDLSVEKVNVDITRENASSLTSSKNAAIQMLSKEEDSKDSMLENSPVTEVIGKVPVTSPSSTILMPDDILVMNVTVKTNVSVGNIQGVTINPIRSIPPDVEAILNITHREKGEDYEYDYSEPTLPPSLPNVRIIPFVAADALVKDKDAPPTVTGYPAGSVVVSPELRPTDNSGFYDIATQENRFSPPIETEGGFVPREPPYFDTPYHSTDLNLEIGTGVTVVPAPITNPHRKNDDLVSNCLFENREHRHGEILPSTGICIICMCYYGEVVCSSEKCPPLKIGCQRINTDEGCCGKVVCVDADESPTVVLDRADATAPSQRQPIVSPDPFRDVIKTEPAPDLPSLIEDMIPYLVEHRITTPRATTPMTTPPPNPSSLNQISSHLKPPQNFDFVDPIPLIHAPFDYRDDAVDGLMTISKNKYRIGSIPNDPHPLSYQAKDPEQLHPLDLPETFAYNPLTVTRPDYTTSGPIINASNPSDSSFVRINATDLSQSQDQLHSTRPSAHRTTPASPQEPSDSQDEDIFSLDSVLDLFFSSDAGSSARPKVTPGSALEAASSSSPRPPSTAGPLSDTKRPDKSSVDADAVAVETPSKILDNEIPVSVAGLLKLAGCNIYGRMYRVGRIITELSGPCLECRCTEIGVQCKQLEC